ncbi:MAG: VanW family protein [Lachnospiraceae bacterium]|nr:VanW family protein [Lachnospiraceae bacterium]
MRTIRTILFSGAFLGLLLLFPLPCRAAGTTIREGVYAQGISLGGMTRTEATQAINAYFEEIADASFTLVCLDGVSETITVSDWEFEWDTKSTVDEALSLGNEGSLIQRYKSQMDLKYGNIYLDVSYQVSSEAVTETLETLGDSHDSPATDAAMTLENGSFVITTTESSGTVTDTDATLNAILEEFADNLGQDMSAEVVSREDTPSVTTAVLEQIEDLLGTFSTTYSDSTSGRKTNIRVATEYLNGTIVMPGESLSISDAIMSRTEENGYEIASQYSNGESEQAIGGGVCQVSTTIYNALLRAELQIDERHAHSMVVSYVDYGDDAAIAEGTKDLVFTNNLDNPIYIYGVADGSTLTFSIYGVETRAENRTVEYVAETTYLEWPTERIEVYSSSLATGTSVISGTLRPAVTATLTKVVYIDGVETERTLLHTDYYAASQQTITYGTG